MLQPVLTAYKPSRWGEIYHALPHHEALGAGSAGPGKTQVLLMDAVPQIVVEGERVTNPKHPYPLAPGMSTGWALHLRRTMPMVEQTIVRSHRVFPQIDPKVHWDAQKHTWTFSSGYRYQFGHCRDLQDWEIYFSGEYCCAKDTLVVMADGSRKAIQDIVAGESVMTLEGPRPVTDTWATGRKPCVEAVVSVDGKEVGRQVHPTTHPILLSSWGSEDVLGGRKRPNGWVWHDFESLLKGFPESPIKRVPVVSEQDAKAWVAHVPVVVAGDGIRSDSCGYPHFYYGLPSVCTLGTRDGTALMTFVGERETFDLTVDRANHYITDCGLINAQTWIGFDELVQFTEEQYNQISGRCRSSDPVLSKMLKVRAMSNPSMSREGMENLSVTDPLWVRKRFVDEAPEGNVTLVTELTLGSGEVERRTRIYLPAKLKDNPDPEFRKQYEATLLDKPEHIRKAMLEGDWYYTAGSFFTDWDPALHVCNPFTIPEDWPKFRSLDWGFKLPGVCHWWAMDDDGNIFCTDEYVFQGKTVPEVAKEIIERETENGTAKHGKSSLTGPADTQLWEQRDAGKSKTKYAEFREHGVNWLQANKKSRADNAQKLSARLRDHQQKTTTPGIVFFRHCRKVIKTIPSVVAQGGNPETPTDFTDDHALDSTLYTCAFVSRGREAIPVHRLPDDDDDFEERQQESAPRGRYGYGAH